MLCPFDFEGPYKEGRTSDPLYADSLNRHLPQCTYGESYLPPILSMNFGRIFQGLLMTRKKYTGIPSTKKLNANRGDKVPFNNGVTSRNTNKHTRRIATGTMNQACMYVCMYV